MIPEPILPKPSQGEAESKISDLLNEVYRKVAFASSLTASRFECIIRESVLLCSYVKVTRSLEQSLNVLICNWQNSESQKQRNKVFLQGIKRILCSACFVKTGQSAILSESSSVTCDSVLAMERLI
jgi:hypothetical protein